MACSARWGPVEGILMNTAVSEKVGRGIRPGRVSLCARSDQDLKPQAARPANRFFALGVTSIYLAKIATNNGEHARS
jgi:hypothetical protein